MSDEMTALLGTDDEAKQVETVKGLVNLAQAPIFSLFVLVDARKDRAEVISAANFEQQYAILELARKEIMRREREFLLAQKAPAPEPVNQPPAE